MTKFNKWRLAILVIIFVIFLVIEVTGCSINNSSQAKKTSPQPSKLAEPFESVAGKLLETSSFPVYLPTYIPPPYEENKWHLTLETNKNKFTIEIDEWAPDQRTGTGKYAGTLSGNIENPSGPPIVNQIMSENKEVKKVVLDNGIEGKEYILDLDNLKVVSWENGKWSYFIAARPDNQEDNIRNFASEIIETIGVNGLALSGSSGKLYFLDIGANHPTTEIFWKVNDSVWYQLDWRDNPSQAIKILRSMKYIGAEKKVSFDSKS